MRTTTRDARTLLVAARMVDSGAINRSCLAIDAVVGAVEHSSLRTRYAKSMLGGIENPRELDWSGDVNSDEANKVRVLLLCFAAALSSTGDLRRKMDKVGFGKRCLQHPLFCGMRYLCRGNPKYLNSCVGCLDEATEKKRSTPEGKRKALERVRPVARVGRRRVHRKPTLVCLNNSSDTLTRYVPKPNGGFFTEAFAIEDRKGFDESATVDTIEQVRLGKMRGQETPPDLVDQPEVA